MYHKSEKFQAFAPDRKKNPPNFEPYIWILLIHVSRLYTTLMHRSSVFINILYKRFKEKISLSLSLSLSIFLSIR